MNNLEEKARARAMIELQKHILSGSLDQELELLCMDLYRIIKGADDV